MSEKKEKKEKEKKIEKTEKEIKTAEIEGEEEQGALAFIFDWASALIFALVLVLLVLTFVVRQVTVNGTSMNDTLQNGDRLIVTNFLYQPQDGDIIVASHGENYTSAIIKRVIATPGQTLSINYETGEVKVDGVIISEKYIKGTTKEIVHPLEIPKVIPEGYVFVMGDNRENSLDSRSRDVGLVPVNNIVGKAIYRMYPFNAVGGIYDNVTEEK